MPIGAVVAVMAEVGVEPGVVDVAVGVPGVEVKVDAGVGETGVDVSVAGVGDPGVAVIGVGVDVVRVGVGEETAVGVGVIKAGLPNSLQPRSGAVPVKPVIR